MLTNAPVIIFYESDNGKSIKNAIEQAYNSRLSFYAYREPWDPSVTIGTSEGLIEGLGEPGFVISRFDNDKPFITIPFANTKTNFSEKVNSETQISASTSEEEYKNEVNEIINGAKKGEWDKIVAARVKIFDSKIDLGQTFFNLCTNNPNAFIFCFSTPLTGCWIGASPELLLKSNGNSLTSMSLAGTKPLKEENNAIERVMQIWDKKNIKEQDIVTHYIKNIFSSHGIKAKAGETDEMAAGKVEHLCTIIKGEKERSLTTENLTSLLRDLSPTPALSGFPKEIAMKFISRHEKFSRECYGGFCGPYRNPDNFYFHVNIRCAKISDNRCSLFAGGGITADSNAEDEWNETEIKLKTMLSALNI